MNQNNTNAASHRIELQQHGWVTRIVLLHTAAMRVCWQKPVGRAPPRKVQARHPLETYVR